MNKISHVIYAGLFITLLSLAANGLPDPAITQSVEPSPSLGSGALNRRDQVATKITKGPRDVQIVNIFRPSEQSPARIAVLLGLNDPHNLVAVEMERGLRVAQALLRKSYKREFKFDVFPHDSSLESLVAAINKMKSASPYSVVIGGVQSHEALVLAQQVNHKTTVYLTPTGADDRVPKSYPFAFQYTLNQTNTARAAAKELKELCLRKGLKRIGILENVSRPYSTATSKIIREELESLPNEPKIFHRSIIQDQKSFSDELKYYKANDVELVALFSYYKDLSQALADGQSIDYYPRYFGGEGWGSEPYLKDRILKRHPAGPRFVGEQYMGFQLAESDPLYAKFLHEY